MDGAAPHPGRGRLEDLEHVAAADGLRLRHFPDPRRHAPRAAGARAPRIALPAAAMMLVYLGWLMFAAALNEEVLRLNPNAEAVAPTGSGTNIAL